MYSPLDRLMVRNGCNTEEPRPMGFPRWTNLVQSCWEDKADLHSQRGWWVHPICTWDESSSFLRTYPRAWHAHWAACQFSAHTSQEQKISWIFLPKMSGSIPTWLQAIGLMGIHQPLFYMDDKLRTDNAGLIPVPPKLSGTSVWL